MSRRTALSSLVRDTLVGGTQFLTGLHHTSDSVRALMKALEQWGQGLGRDLTDVLAGVESCLRQNVLMSLVPALAVDPSYIGSVDEAIDEHVAKLGVKLTDEERAVVRNVCLNVRKYQGMDAGQASGRTMSLPGLRGGNPKLYQAILLKQNRRCVWCGVALDSTHVVESLEHIAPKLIGDDLADGSNWALSCLSCNRGKGESLAWGAQPTAQDYLSRTDFDNLKTIGLPQRWAVLVRVRKCDKCHRGPVECELLVYRRLETGLPIPSNCSATCTECGMKRGCAVLTPRWHPRESGRVTPAWSAI